MGKMEKNPMVGYLHLSEPFVLMVDRKDLQQGG